MATFKGTYKADNLIGTTGSDMLYGYDGNDTYTVNHIGDIVIETSLWGSGIDTVLSSIKTYTLPTNIENLTLIGGAIEGIGNGLNNVITGNQLDNIIKGGGGDDDIDGGNGGKDVIYGDAGDDQISCFNGTSDNKIESIVHGGTGNDNLAGGGRIYGDGGNDNIYLKNTIAACGGDGDDYFYGGTYSNGAVAYGQNGNDTFNDLKVANGGNGNDTYIINHVGDIVKEAAPTNLLGAINATGIDTVLSSIKTYTLPVNVENLTLVGSAVEGIGNALNNTIIGTSQSNIIRGGGGNDTIRDTEGGRDVIYGDTGCDTIDGGYSNIASIIHGGSGNDKLMGGGKLYGDSGNDDISGYNIAAYGGSGNDTISGDLYEEISQVAYGESGNDKFFDCRTAFGGDGDDVFTNGIGFNGGPGKDTMFIGNMGNYQSFFTDFNSIDDTIKLNKLEFTEIKPGQLSPDNFLVVGSRQMDTNDFVIYNEANHTVYYDVDGCLSDNDANPIVTIGFNSTINASDFIIA